MQTLDEAIAALEEAVRQAERAQRSWLVADALTDRIRDRGRAVGYMESHELAEAKVARMTDARLEIAFQSVYDSYWETAKSEAHEWYDQDTGRIDGLQQALAIVKGEVI